jgi:uncharacterized protein (DUF924 family)
MLLTEKEINSILNFWFPNDNYNTFWFDKSVDEVIYKNYFHLLHDTYNATVEKDFEFCYEELLALIILFDQFSRNINRIVNINVTDFTYEARRLSLQVPDQIVRYENIYKGDLPKSKSLLDNKKVQDVSPSILEEGLSNISIT